MFSPGAQERLFGERGTKTPPRPQRGPLRPSCEGVFSRDRAERGISALCGQDATISRQIRELQVTRFRPRVRALGGSRLPRGSFGVAVRWWPESAWGIRRRSL